MNPKEFGWKEDQQVTVTNPTKEDFKFGVHGKEYLVGAGQTAKMPGFLAWVYVYKLGSKLAQEANDFIHWNEEGFRKQYFDRLVAGVDQIIEVVQAETSADIERLDMQDEQDEPEQEEDEAEDGQNDPEEDMTVAGGPIRPMSNNRSNKRSRNGRSSKS